MRISKQSRRDARQLFRVCVVNAALDDNRVRTATAEVIRQKPRGYLQVLSHFHRLVKLEIARRSAKIESATPLSPQTQSAIQSDLTRRYGAGLTFAFTQNAALIGGARVQVGGDVYDGSVEARLKALEESF